MTSFQVFLTVMIAAAVTLLTRAVSFLVFSGGKQPPAFVSWLGAQLPRAVMLMLVVYCLKDVSFSGLGTWLPAFTGVAVTVVLHLWRKRMIVSIAGGTAVYMLLIRLLGVV